MRTLELFAGIGGLHAACPWLDVIAAVDINRDSRLVYSSNFAAPYIVRELETIPITWLESQQAELWWMSPPCAPFTRKGARRDLQDVRTRSLKHLIDAAATIRPKILVVENVVGFENSLAFSHLSKVWHQAGYNLQVHLLCPTQLGWPNRRPRIYIVATQGSDSKPCLSDHHLPNPRREVYLKDVCSSTANDIDPKDLMLDAELVAKYRPALDMVDVENPSAVAACFGASYGRAITKAGSYLMLRDGIRRFSPREVANILGFPSTFCLPHCLTPRRLWQLLGNSLSLPAVSHLMQFTRS